MALSRLGIRNRPGDFTWPGFVDALASLLMVFVFVLMVFVLIQANLAYRLSGQDASLSALRQELAQLGELLSLEREAGSVLSADLARTSAQLAIAEEQNNSLTAQLEQLTRQLASESADKRRLQADLDAEKAALADLQARSLARTKAFEEQLSQTSQRLAAQTQSLGQQTRRADTASAEVARLTTAMESLRSELSRLRALLAEREKQAEEDKIAIANLGKALNSALANKVQELRRFRSEFFGRLRDVLEGRSDVKIVGDRFVFQSEVLFAPGQASIGEEGQKQLAQIAAALTEIIREIPDDIPWILQIDGHTDDVPVSGVYADNWDLSTERALSVVRFMIREGVPASRLSASGYGEFQPIATGNSVEDRQKNRRIELKLTQRVKSE
ncbi:MAG: peptidoglycan-binding protein [Candidatus Puniceispirillaceae bacterium]|jgi:chemotaxis protein MotB|nr:OmpA family protein [Pseudomonadota bacterium]